jgi:hypothetical protein
MAGGGASAFAGSWLVLLCLQLGVLTAVLLSPACNCIAVGKGRTSGQGWERSGCLVLQLGLLTKR